MPGEQPQGPAVPQREEQHHGPPERDPPRAEGDRVAGGTQVDIVGEYEPTKYEFRKGDYWSERKMQVSEHQR